MTNPIIQKTDRPICIKPDCTNIRRSYGSFCRNHAMIKNGCGQCSVDGCDKWGFKSGMCGSHYARLRKYGDPIGCGSGTQYGAPLQWIKDHVNYKGADCLIWPFGHGSNGYGSVRYGGRAHVASRVMCIIAHGKPADDSLEAAHECGNGQSGCVNPNHLTWKTRKDNMLDMVKHGHSLRGEKSPQSKLNKNEVLEMRALEGKMDTHKIAEQFGISERHVMAILARTWWAWLK